MSLLVSTIMRDLSVKTLNLTKSVKNDLKEFKSQWDQVNMIPIEPIVRRSLRCPTSTWALLQVVQHLLPKEAMSMSLLVSTIMRDLSVKTLNLTKSVKNDLKEFKSQWDQVNMIPIEPIVRRSQRCPTSTWALLQVVQHPSPKEAMSMSLLVNTIMRDPSVRM